LERRYRSAVVSGDMGLVRRLSREVGLSRLWWSRLLDGLLRHRGRLNGRVHVRSRMEIDHRISLNQLHDVMRRSLSCSSVDGSLGSSVDNGGGSGIVNSRLVFDDDAVDGDVKMGNVRDDGDYSGSSSD